MIEKLWFYPPLAFARLGESSNPVEAFHWGPNDARPDGTGKTTVVPAKTIEVDEGGGGVKYSLPERVTFRDEKGLKPVCPFFELHGSWRHEGAQQSESGPITPALLSSLKLQLSDLRWKVEVANLKPFYMTQDNDTRISAVVEMAGDDFKPKELRGTSPAEAKRPLVPKDKHIPLGVVRLVESGPDDVLRLRFYPPRGLVYGPANFRKRDFGGELYAIPDDCLFLNPASVWTRWTPPKGDTRGLPGGQFANDANGVSLGLVDDVSDGVISCRVEKENRTARARVVVAPPHFAPDRRHIVTIADGLKDRDGRDEVHQDAYFSDEKEILYSVDSRGEFRKEEVTALRMSSLEVNDLLERAFETVGLTNMDALNNRVDTVENPAYAIMYGERYKRGEHRAFPVLPSTPEDPLPLSDLAARQHRRFSALEVFENILRQRPALIREWVRPPAGDNPLFDSRMPALMRGSAGEPLHLTRRQYDLLVEWARKLREAVEEDS